LDWNIFGGIEKEKNEKKKEKKVENGVLN